MPDTSIPSAPPSALPWAGPLPAPLPSRWPSPSPSHGPVPSPARDPAQPEPAGGPADPGPRPFWLRPEIEWPSLRPLHPRPGGRRAPSHTAERRCTGPGGGPEACSRALCRRHGRCRPPKPGPREALAGPPGGLGATILHLADAARASGAASGPERARHWLDLGLRLRALMRPALFDDPAAFEQARATQGDASVSPGSGSLSPPAGRGVG